MPASVVRERVGADCWSQLYRFCFERNPWDKAVSMYFWRTRRNDKPPPFETWATKPGSLVSERDLYTIDGELAVDFVGRYETLADDLGAVLDRVGLTGVGRAAAREGRAPPGEERHADQRGGRRGDPARVRVGDRALRLRASRRHSVEMRGVTLRLRSRR